MEKFSPNRSRNGPIDYVVSQRYQCNFLEVISRTVFSINQ
jgi:hypothetical protein